MEFHHQFDDIFITKYFIKCVDLNKFPEKWMKPSKMYYFILATNAVLESKALCQSIN